MYSSIKANFKIFIRSCAISAILAWMGNVYAVGETELPQHAAKDFVESGAADYSVNGAIGVVNQISQRAILNWQRFNIGQQATMRFIQPSNQAVAVNKIFQADPSRILGNLQANGQVYLINPNGIIFGEGAQVNVGALVASTLGIRDEVVNEVGLLQEVNRGGAAFEAGAGLERYAELVDEELPDDMGLIRIEPNAELASGPGGFIMIIAPAVINEGTIRTHDSRAILAASNHKVFLAEPPGSESPRLVDMLIEVDLKDLPETERADFLSANVGAGQVINRGLIEADRGNVTLMGMAVNQEGIVRATSAVDFGGEIQFLARDTRLRNLDSNGNPVFVSEFGDVAIGPNSITETMPHLSNSETAPDSQAHTPSRIRAIGKTIHIGEQAKLTARGGEIEVLALSEVITAPKPNEFSIAKLRNEDGTAPAARLNESGDGVSKITIESGVEFDVSGLTPQDWENWKNARPEDAGKVNPLIFDMARNTEEVDISADELRDSPLQRDEEINPDRVLIGKKVVFDIRKDLPDIVDVSSVLQNRQRTVAERNTLGGTISIKSTGSIQIDPQTKFNIRGGSVEYTEGQLKTTVLGANRRLFDIANAPKDIIYDTVYDPDAFGNRADNVERGYVEGKDAGTLELYAYDIDSELHGNVDGRVVRGIHQRKPSSDLNLDANLLEDSPIKVGAIARAYDEAPVAGKLALGRARDVFLADAGDGRIAFYNDATRTGHALIAQGLATIQADAAQRLILPQDETLVLNELGDYEFSAPGIELLGKLKSAASKLNFVTADPLGGRGEIEPGNYSLVVGNTAEIDVSGRWINDTGSREAVLPIPSIDAGRIKLNADSGHMTMNGDLYADAGGWVDASGSFSPGLGGEISLAVDYDRTTNVLRVGDGVTMQAYTFGGDARSTLSLTAPGFLVRKGGATFSGVDDNGVVSLQEGLFASGGFTDFDLTATHKGIDLEDGVQIRMDPDLIVVGNPASLPNGSDHVAAFGVRKGDIRQRPATRVALKQVSNNFSDLNALVRIGVGALIETSVSADSGIALSSDGSILVEGGLRARGGDIALSIEMRTDLDPPGQIDGQAIWLTDTAFLDVAAAEKTFIDRNGFVTGELVAGGSISLAAEQGYVIAEPGSRFDIRGGSASIDVLNDVSLMPSLRAGDREHAPGGKLELETAQGLFFFGDVLAGVPADNPYSGGRVTVNLDPGDLANNRINDEPTFPILKPRVIFGAQHWSALGLDKDSPFVPSELQGLAMLDPSMLQDAGVDDLVVSVRPHRSNDPTKDGTNPQLLGAGIEFVGDHDLQFGRLVLDGQSLISDGGHVRLSGRYVALGSNNTDFELVELPTATSGNGVLEVSGGIIDLVGLLALQGFTQNTFDSATDIRLRGVWPGKGDALTPEELTLPGGLFAEGDVVLNAARAIYVTSLSDYRIGVNNGVLTFDGGSIANPLLYSAGGSLIAEAPAIVQRGHLAVPLGSIELVAETSLTLAPGSVTSVTADGADIPYGFIDEDGAWVVLLDRQAEVPGEREQVVLEAPPKKLLALRAESLELKEGAEIDTRGGGDIVATTFITGPGGATDLLTTANAAGAFALVPAIGQDVAPWDPSLSRDFRYAPGTLIEIVEGSGIGLPAGVYTVLPAQYAQVNGGFLVTPVAADADIRLPGQTSSGVDGVTTFAGRFMDPISGEFAHRWSAFKIESQAQVAKRAEYDVRRANDYFANQAATAAALLPLDAGQLILDVGEDLLLDGSLRNDNGEGAAPTLDITGTKIAIVDALETVANEAGQIELSVRQLENFGAGRVLIGGTRQELGGETLIDVSADSVSISDNDGGGLLLALPELIMVGRDGVTVGSGVTLASQPGSLSMAASERVGALTDGDGIDAAVLAVSERELIGFRGFNIGSGRGKLSIAADARLIANGSLVMLAGGSLDMSGSITLTENATQVIGVSGYTIGEETSIEGGSLHVITDTLGLNGPLDLALRSLSIDASGIRGDSDVNIDVAGSVWFENSRGSTNPGDPESGTGTLAISAAEVLLGDGDFGVDGFATTRIETGSVVGVGEKRVVVSSSGETETRTSLDGGALNVSGDLTINTSILTVSADGLTRIASTGDLSVMTSDRQPGSVGNLFGGRMALSGESVELDTHVSLASGALSVKAHGADGDVDLGENALIDVAGKSVVFDKLKRGAPGGSVSLASDQGDVRLRDGAAILLFGAGEEGRAGALTILAEQGEADIDIGATLLAGAANDDLRQGDFALDAKVLTRGMDDLNKVVERGGFRESRYVRVREGDLTLSDDQRMSAAEITLVADGGGIDIAGVLDAGVGRKAGEIGLYARDRVSIMESAGAQSGARLIAGSTERGHQGGKVYLEVTGDNGRIELDGGIEFAEAGVLRLTTPRDNGGSALGGIASFTGNVSGAERIELVGMQRYVTGTNGRLGTLFDSMGNSVGGTNQIDSVNDRFWNDVGSKADLIARLGAVVDPDLLHVMPGVQIESPADLRVDTDLDLAGWRSGTEDEIGVLRLLAGRDLLVRDGVTVGDGFNVDARTNDPLFTNLVFDQLIKDDSWEFQLTAGADRSSAYHLATTDEGRFLLGDGAVVRTGTGDLTIATASDLELASKHSAIYTAGQDIGAGAIAEAAGGVASDTSYDISFLNLWASGIVFADNGGDMNLHIGGDLTGKGSDQAVMNWRLSLGATTDVGETEAGTPPTLWGIAFDKFAQNIGVLGGGDMDVRVTGDVTDVWFNSATSGQPVGTVTFVPDSFDLAVAAIDNQVAVVGGGDMDLQIGGDFSGGGLYHETGIASVRVGGDIGVDVHDANDLTEDGLVIAMGDTALSLESRGDLVLDMVYNPSFMSPTSDQTLSAFPRDIDDYRNRFISYGENTRLSVVSLNGDLQFSNRNRLEGLNGLELEEEVEFSTRLYPAVLQVLALGGDINLRESMYLMPSPKGQVDLLADGSIRSNKANSQGIVREAFFVQSDLSPSELPDWQNPLRDISTFGDNFTAGLTEGGPTHGISPVFGEDTGSNHLVARNGDISDLRFSLAKQSRVIAGRDIHQVWLDLQHSMDASLGEDFSIVQAGRDISYEFERDVGFGFEPEGSSNGIVIAGDGELLVIAGRDIKLGDSLGILSTGNNSSNNDLPNIGADINVLAGVTVEPEYQQLIDTYLADPEKQIWRYEVTLNLVAGEFVDTDTQSDFEDFRDLFKNAADFWLVGMVTEADRVKATLEFKGTGGEPALPTFIEDIGAFANRVEQRPGVIASLNLSSGPYSYRTLARQYVEEKAGLEGISEDDAITWLRESDDQRENLDFYLDVYESELIAGGQRAALESNTLFFDRSKLAVDTFFPTAPRAPLQSRQGLSVAAARGLVPGMSSTSQPSSVLDAFSTNSFQALNPTDIDSINIAGQAPRDPSTEIEVDPATGRITAESIDHAWRKSRYRGDVVSLFSRISTEDGGDLRVMVPGGDFVGGTVARQDVPTGTVVPREGNLSVIAGGDVLVNSAKIINRSSGRDLSVWSSVGNIDAGSGDRSATVTAASLALGVSGLLIPNDSPDIVGSGIQNEPAGDGAVGNTYLMTELGVINAGTAGISARRVTIFAAALQNIEGLDFGSVTSSDTLSLGDSSPPATDLSAPTNPADLVGDPTEDLAASGVGENEDEQLALLSVEVLGFGLDNLPATGAGDIDCSDERNLDRQQCVDQAAERSVN